MPKNDKFKDYARYANHCLNTTAATRDQDCGPSNAKWPSNG